MLLVQIPNRSQRRRSTGLRVRVGQIVAVSSTSNHLVVRHRDIKVLHPHGIIAIGTCARVGHVGAVTVAVA